jgi:uncharacterized protein YjbI with pentapeptide repeats
MEYGLKTGGAMITQLIEMNQFIKQESYQVIKDEHLAFTVITHQMLTGSAVSKSSYQQVVFSGCHFYACEFQAVTFENCIFENCTFEFTHFRHSSFKNCNFTDCKWQASSSRDSIYMDCILDFVQDRFCHNGHNVIINQNQDQHTTDIYIDLALAG